MNVHQQYADHADHQPARTCLDLIDVIVRMDIKKEWTEHAQVFLHAFYYNFSP